MDTLKQGESLRTMLCQRAYDGRMVLAGFKGELHDMERTTEFLHAVHTVQYGKGEIDRDKLRAIIMKYREGV